MSDKAPELQKLNGSHAKVMSLLKLTCTFSFFLFFFTHPSSFHLSALKIPLILVLLIGGSAFPVLGLPVREGPPSCHPVAHRRRSQTSTITPSKFTHLCTQNTHKRKSFPNFFFPFTHLEPGGVFYSRCFKFLPFPVMIVIFHVFE